MLASRSSVYLVKLEIEVILSLVLCEAIIAFGDVKNNNNSRCHEIIKIFKVQGSPVNLRILKYKTYIKHKSVYKVDSYESESRVCFKIHMNL